MKHIVFGGFDYAVYYEMDQDAIFHGVDYFVDNNPALIGTSYLGKPIKAPTALLEENKGDILILIGSIVYRTEIAFQLKEMGFEEDKDFVWGISFSGDGACRRLWKHVGWNDKASNAAELAYTEESNEPLDRLKIISKMIDFKRIDTLIDLGAANARIKAFIPQKIRYIPVDYMRYSDETVLCDFNQKEFPRSKNLKFDPQKTCMMSIATIQYAVDWKWYLDEVIANCNYLIFAKRDFGRVSREHRKTRWNNNNAAFNHEYLLYLLQRGFSLVDAVDFRLKAEIYSFKKA